MSAATLAGRTAVVTGATRGIGLAIARALAEAGARVVLLARDREKLRVAASSLSGDAVIVACDLCAGADVDRGAAEIRSSVGVPDILVNNAGAFALGRVGELALAEVERMVEVNLLAPYRLLHHLVPAMRERGSGHVVTIGSIADHVAYPENGGYAASKFGVRGLHEVLRAELRETGVRATLVSPGPVDTAMWDPIDPDTRAGFTPREDMLQPEDVAEAVLWVVTRKVEVGEVRM